MYKSHLDLPAAVKSAAIAVLQQRLSDALDLEAQTKQAHWNVKGRDFFQLHQLFDAVHDEVEAFVDTLAERITTLGGFADGRVQTTAASSGIEIYPADAKAGADHLQALAKAFGQFASAARADIDKAAALPDADTADVLTEVSRGADKQLWLIEAHLAA